MAFSSPQKMVETCIKKMNIVTFKKKKNEYCFYMRLLLMGNSLAVETCTCGRVETAHSSM